MPSFAVTLASIDIILESTNNELVFPVDVEYDFDRLEWIDNQNEPIRLPWAMSDGEVYPLLNDILLVKSGLLLYEAYEFNTHWSDSLYMVDSSTRCLKQPESYKCKRSFYCVGRGIQSEKQAPMTLEDAIARCTELGGSIDTRFILSPKKEKSEIVLWTGALCYNESHFRRPDGGLIKPVGFEGSHRDFPTTVHVRIARDDGVLEAYNSFGHAFNQADSDRCLCYLTTSGVVKQLIQHKKFYYVVLLALLSVSFALFLACRKRHRTT